MADNFFDQPPRAAKAEPWSEEAPPPGGEADYGDVRAFPSGERLDAHKPTAAIKLAWFNEIEPSLDAADFVQGLLIAGSAAVVYGESNSGKTFWTTDLALHVAAGREWNGKRVEQGGVVYAALEGSIGFRNRVAAWKAEHGLGDYDLPFAAIQQPLNLRAPQDDVEALIEAAEGAKERMGVPLCLIVIDTLSRALAGGDENAPEDMGALVMCMDLIRQRTGAAVLFIHHSGKDLAKGARGHSLLRAAVDTEIEIAAEDGAHTATVVKQRELRKGDTFAFTLRVVELGTNRHGEAVTTCVVEAADRPVSGGVSASRLKGHAKRAYEVLDNLIGQSGVVGHSGAPASVASVPDEWWRDRFYTQAVPGAEPKTKKMAFARATEHLISNHLVGMSSNRVWIVRRQDAQP